jgi:tetratricopeptide (TPR) repeat protein
VFPAIACLTLFAQPAFDYFSVQRDILTGISDPQALKRGMEACEKALAVQPDHPAALVYHGIGLLIESQTQPELFPKGIAEMDRAVQLDPANLGVRIPRASTLMAISRQMPESPFRQAQIAKARADFQYAFDTQKDQLDELGTHPLGELLQNLGDIYSRLDKPEEARKYYALIQNKLPGTEYYKRAQQWMETSKPLPAEQAACIGCHTGRKQ